MPEQQPPPARPSFPWWIILCLVGLDYFSTISYLPSIALAQMHDLREYIPTLDIAQMRAIAPVAALGVVLVTVFGVLPVYLYVAGKSPHGKGGIGLLETRFTGWLGKLVMLILLGFVAADFVLTRSLSTSDAAAHIEGNRYYQQHASWIFRTWLPGLAPWLGLTEQVGLSVLLMVAAFGLYFFLVNQLSKGFLGAASGIVVAYILLNAIVLWSSWSHIQEHPEVVAEWKQNLSGSTGDISGGGSRVIPMLLLLALVTFPAMAIGVSGFELTLATAPLIRGSSSDDPHYPARRIFNTRLMMVSAAVIMSVLVLASVYVVTLLLPESALYDFKTGEVRHRSLSYLAHGGLTNTGAPVSTWFGDDFGTLYDLVTIMTLCLAGASATVSLRDIVPDFLTRFGMQVAWARQTGVILHLFNGLILLTTIVFKASVTSQQWAYSASVLALMFGAALAALLDVRAVWKGSAWRFVMQAPFFLITALFLLMGILITIQRPSGELIALGFVAVVMVTAIVSRWLNSTEPRFQKFRFATPEAEEWWDEARAMEFQIIVPHSRGGAPLSQKEEEIRRVHRLGPNVPILFVEVEVGDPSSFAVEPILDTTKEDGRTIMRVTEATSVPHAIAAVALTFCEMGRPPEVHFGWGEESPLAANLNFVLLGEGNIPWMVQELCRRAEPDRSKRPRIIVG
jgi:hypothetical protein